MIIAFITGNVCGVRNVTFRNRVGSYTEKPALFSSNAQKSLLAAWRRHLTMLLRKTGICQIIILFVEVTLSQIHL